MHSNAFPLLKQTYLRALSYLDGIVCMYKCVYVYVRIACAYAPAFIRVLVREGARRGRVC